MIICKGLWGKKIAARFGGFGSVLLKTVNNIPSGRAARFWAEISCSQEPSHES